MTIRRADLRLRALGGARERQRLPRWSNRRRDAAKLASKPTLISDVADFSGNDRGQGRGPNVPLLASAPSRCTPRSTIGWHHMTGKPRTTFGKLQRERARQAKQAAKRARRQGTTDELGPLPGPSVTLETADVAQASPAGSQPQTPAKDPNADADQ